MRPGTEDVLVIDDDPAVRKLAERQLEQAGYRPLTADGGRAGILKALSQRPDLILLDLAMPELNGLEVLRALRSDERTKGIPVLCFTGLAEPADLLQVASLELRADDFLRKPWRMPDFLGRVAKLLSRRRRAWAGPDDEGSDQGPALIEKGRLRVDTRTQDVWVQGRRLGRLGPRRFQVLCALLRHGGQATSEQLRQLVWRGGENLKTVSRTVERLRRDLGPLAEGAIIGIPGGHRLLG